LVEEALHKEFGLAFHMQPGNRRYLLAGCVFDRTKEEATLESLESFATFEPSPGKAKGHQEFLFFSKEITLELAEV
jgi:hypothetical protein